MRDIKFRAWNNSTKYWLDMYFFFKFINGTLEYTEVDNVVIEQYTGLKDKNGVEIYDGDILKSVNGNPDVVIYIDGRFEPICWYNPESFEVIGNIHENADLLEEQS